MAPLSKHVSNCSEPLQGRSFWLGLGLAIGAIALSVLGFSLQGREAQDSPDAPEAVTNQEVPPRVGLRPLPARPLILGVQEVEAPPLNSAEVGSRPLEMRLEQTDAGSVYRIRTHSQGDELIIDATTGKLLAVVSTPMEPAAARNDG